MEDATYTQALSVLKEALSAQDTHQINEKKDQVFGRFHPLLSNPEISRISEDDFKAFLRLRNNLHWSGLQRLGPMMCADMTLLRESLTLLVDENKPITSRLTTVISNIKGMRTAVSTAILLVSYPEKYGVWNNTSEAGLKAIGLWPDFDRGEPLGYRYEKINGTLNKLAGDLGIDLWTLDTLWWAAQGVKVPVCDLMPSINSDLVIIDDGDDEETGIIKFSLERHLHDFLRDNWNETALGKEWDIFSEAGEPEKGYEYPCAVGRIDLLASHKTRPEWLVIELKRGQTGDATVGQVLRYMGWVKLHLAKSDEVVKGLIIARDTDQSLRYALTAVENVTLQHYKVDFHLDSVALPETNPNLSGGQKSNG